MEVQFSILSPSIRPEYLDVTQKCLELQTFQNFEWLVEVGLRNRGCTLATDLNRMLRRAKGSRIIMLQDCIRIEPDTLEKIDTLPNEFYTFPVGKVDEFGDNPRWDWRDQEEHQGKITPNLWEADFAAAPLQAFIDIGGYDERFNEGWSWDNVEVAWRAQAAGYAFYNSKIVHGIAWDHDKFTENPWRKTLPLNDKRAEETRNRAFQGDFKLDYI
jgi:hypothetical protein